MPAAGGPARPAAAAAAAACAACARARAADVPGAACVYAARGSLQVRQSRVQQMECRASLWYYAT
jgi:hypothetical protein